MGDAWISSTGLALLFQSQEASRPVVSEGSKPSSKPRKVSPRLSIPPRQQCKDSLAKVEESSVALPRDQLSFMMVGDWDKVGKGAPGGGSSKEEARTKMENELLGCHFLLVDN